MSAVSCSDKADHDSIIDRGEISFSAQVGNTGTKMTDNSWEGGEVIGVKVAETEKTYIVDKEGAMTVSGAIHTSGTESLSMPRPGIHIQMNRLSWPTRPRRKSSMPVTCFTATLPYILRKPHSYSIIR